MLKTLIKHGNSHALIIDKTILDLLKINPETTKLEIVTDGNVLMVTPVRDKKQQKELNSALADINNRYGEVFKRLAQK